MLVARGEGVKGAGQKWWRDEKEQIGSYKVETGSKVQYRGYSQ